MHAVLFIKLPRNRDDDFKGYLYMPGVYFKLKTVVVMVNKAALPETERKVDVK